MYWEVGIFQKYKDIRDSCLKGGREQKRVEREVQSKCYGSPEKERLFAWEGLGETSLEKSSRGFSSGP